MIFKYLPHLPQSKSLRFCRIRAIKYKGNNFIENIKEYDFLKKLLEKNVLYLKKLTYLNLKNLNLSTAQLHNILLRVYKTLRKAYISS